MPTQRPRGDAGTHEAVGLERRYENVPGGENPGLSSRAQSTFSAGLTFLDTVAIWGDWGSGHCRTFWTISSPHPCEASGLLTMSTPSCGNQTKNGPDLAEHPPGETAPGWVTYRLDRGEKSSNRG